MEKLDELVKEARMRMVMEGIFKLNFGERRTFVQESKASPTVGVSQKTSPMIDSFPWPFPVAGIIIKPMQIIQTLLPQEHNS